MSTPNEPQNPYGAGDQPEQPGGTPQQPGSTPQQPGGGQYPPAPQYPSAPQYPGEAQQPGTPYPAAPQYGGAGQYPGGGYGQPAYGYPKNNLGVWSFVLGLVGIVLSCGFFTGIPAVIVGSKAKKAVASGEANNSGLATAGIILGWVAIALSVLGIIFFIAIGGIAGYTDFLDEMSNTPSGY
ncbi:DUF4190 domain-containing protein [Cellulomonas cellasea]|uniref:DUF4190 domain-containing protein n=1 Tax=Cellulomonas cellasea TaxID=43670 RepID=UPI0025A43276|nr:DUF4190 domain-containing protein [Cellulomonas cellasea]MDM8084288.1 DUF4190 domain-containing protein [Cellulomonas cellasea]